jgi:hypothetical protein
MIDGKQQIQKRKAGSFNKFYVLVVFLCFDLGLNSTLDYDSYSEGKKGFIILALLGLQIVVQISVFLLLFLTVADTFLFRVGLLDILLRKIRTVLIVQIVYFAITIATGTKRIALYDSGKDLVSLTTSNSFVTLSIVQKMGESAISPFFFL